MILIAIWTNTNASLSVLINFVRIIYYIFIGLAREYEQFYTRKKLLRIVFEENFYNSEEIFMK